MLHISLAKQMLSKGNLEGAITILLNSSLSNKSDETIIVSSNFNRLKQQSIIGLIDNKERILHENKISSALLDIIKGVELNNSFNKSDELSIEVKNAIAISEKLKDSLMSFNVGDQVKDDLFIQSPYYVDGNESEIRRDFFKFIDEWLYDNDESVNLIVLGERGLGKSTSLKHYANKLATLDKTYQTEGQKQYFPVYVPLSNLIKKMDPSYGFDLYICNYAATSLSMDLALFDKILSTGNILFILDGLDEIGFASSQETKVMAFRSIKKFISDYFSNKFIFAGRPHFFQSDLERNVILGVKKNRFIKIEGESFFKEIHLSHLFESDIKSYFEVYFGGSDVYLSKFNIVKHNQFLYELCKYPFYLNIVCLIIGNDQNDFEIQKVSDKFDLFEEYVESWYDWQNIKNIDLDIPLNNEDRKAILNAFFIAVSIKIYKSRQLSYEFLEKKGKSVEVKKTDLSEILGNILKQNNYSISPSQVDILLSEITTSYFLVLKGESYHFIHELFVEYFVTKHLLAVFHERKFNDEIFKNTEWSNTIIEMGQQKIRALLEPFQSPTLLPFRHGRQKGWFLTKYFTGIRYVLMKLVDIFYFLTTNNIIVSTIIFLLIFLTGYPWVFSTIFIIFNLYLLFFMTKKQQIWNYIYRRIAQERKNKYNFFVKAYNLDFTLGILSISNKNIDLIMNLFDSYTMFPTLHEVTFNKIIIFKHNVINTYFKNFSMQRASAITSNIYDCTLENVDFSGTSFYMVDFENCFMKNTDFSNCKYSAYIFNNLAIIRVLLSYLGLIKKSNNPSMYLINLQKINLENFDTPTLSSLKKFSEKNKLVFGKHILVSNEVSKALDTL